MDVEVLVVDPWGRAMAGSGSENSNDDVRAVLEILGEIKRTAGIADLWVLAHMGHQDFEIGQERARGASDLLGWPDGIVTLTKDEQGTRFLSAQGRDIDFPETALAFEPTTRGLSLVEGGGDRRTSAERALVDKVVSVVSSSRVPLKVSDVHDALESAGISNREQRQQAVRAATKACRIYLDPDERDRRVKWVRLTPDLTSRIPSGGAA